MLDHTAGQVPNAPPQLTIAEIIEGLEPMGDLRQFMIEDRSPEEEDEFFAILDNV